MTKTVASVTDDVNYRLINRPPGMHAVTQAARSFQFDALFRF